MIANACSLVTSYDGFGGAAVCGDQIPGKPGIAAAASPNDSVAYTGGLSQIDFLGEDASTPLGYDLDGLCTCHPDKAACRNPQGANQPCDPAGSGRDNAGGLFLAKVFQGAPSEPLDFGVAARLSQYNGAPDDSSVVVELYNIVGVTTDAGSTPTVTLDNTTIDIVETLRSHYISTDAYVAGGVLVARFNTFKFRVRAVNPLLDGGSFATVDTPLTAPVLIGKVRVTTDNGLQLTNAQLVGRIALADLFDAVDHYGICQDSGPAFQQTRESICNSVDVPSKPVDDGKDTPCDAISIAIGIKMVPVRFSPATGDPASLSTPCGAEAAGSCN